MALLIALFEFVYISISFCFSVVLVFSRFNNAISSQF